MNKFGKYIIFIWLLSASFRSAGQTKDHALIPDIETFLSTKECTRQAGVFPVYAGEKELYLELKADLLGKDILIAAQTERGHGLRNRLLNGLRCVRFAKGEEKNELYLHQLAFPERVSGEDAVNLLPVLSKSNLLPIYKKYIVKAYSPDKNAYLIDLTDDLLTGSSWFDVPSDNRIRGLRPNESRFGEVAAFTDGVSLEIRRMYGTFPADPQGSDPVMSAEGYAPLTIRCRLHLLPYEKMSVRQADPRMGFSSLSFTDYGKYPYAAARDSVIERWNLPRRNGKFDVVIDSRFPPSLAASAAAAVRRWEKAFEKAGYPQAFRIRRENTDDRQPADIHVSFDGEDGGVNSNKIVHPETGEILYATVNFGRKTLENLLHDYFLSCGQPISGTTEKKNIENLLFQSLLVKEMGRILGLKNNYAGSHAYPTAKTSSADWLKNRSYTASVMDENPFNHSMPADTKAPAHARIPIMPGIFDEFAVQWGYGMKYFNEKSRSHALTQAINRNEYAYSADADDIRVNRRDLVSDKIAALEQGMRNLETAFGNMQAYVYENSSVNDGGAQLVQMQRQGVDAYTGYITAAGNYIGPTRNGEFVSREDGKSAVKFIESYLFSHRPDFFQTPYLKQNPLLSDSENKLLQYVPTLFAHLLSEQVTESLTRALSDAGAYSINDLREDVCNSLFPDFQKNETLSPYQMEVQFRFLQTLGKQMKAVEKGGDSYAFQLFTWKEHIRNNLQNRADESTDDTWRIYYAYLQKIIE